MLQIFKSRRLFLLLAGVGILLAAGIIGTLFVMPPLKNADDIVYLKGDDTPYKVRPSEEGGQKIAHQDSRFMNYLDKGEAEAEEAETISLKDDLPEPPPVPLAEENQAEEAVDLTRLSAANTEVSPEKPSRKIETESVIATPLATSDSQPAAVSVGDKDKKSEPASEAAAEPKDEPAAEQVKAPVTAAVPVAKPPVPAKKKPVIEGPARQIQLAAFQTQKRADTAAALLSEKHKARLNGYTLSSNLIEKADGGKFWRVMTSQMPAQEAAAICDALKRAGQDCIVRKTQSTQ
ncbi:MAG: SPOR domain-containing protein [Candidatus Puniceispirillaceae bacterium]